MESGSQIYKSCNLLENPDTNEISEEEINNAISEIVLVSDESVWIFGIGRFESWQTPVAEDDSGVPGHWGLNLFRRADIWKQ